MSKPIRVPDHVYDVLSDYADEKEISIGAAARELIEHPDLDNNAEP